MTTPMPAHHNKNRGFTLLETIIYIGLFGIIFSGIFVSIYPLFTGAERLTRNIVIEGETAFILAKLHHALSDSITSEDGVVVTPREGETADGLVIEYEGNERYEFSMGSSAVFCSSSPLLCKWLMLSIDGNDVGALPLNASRVQIEHFSVTHVAPVGGAPRYLDISFTANDVAVGPVRYYLRF